MAETIERSLLELDFASLTRRTFTPSPAAKAPLSSWRTSTHLMVLRRRASVTGFKLSPTTP